MKRISLFLSITARVAVMLWRKPEISRVNRVRLQENLIDIYDAKRDVMLSIYTAHDFGANAFVCECLKIIHQPKQQRRQK